MKFVSVLNFFLGFIFEIIVFLGYINEVVGFNSFLFIHLIIMLIIYSINKNKKLPFYLAFFFPGIGIIVLMFLDLFLSLTKFKDDMIIEYEKYIEYINKMIIKKNIDFQREINIISALDALKYSSNEIKKDLIINLISDDIDIKVKILKNALKDDDPEVVHYASSTLNLIENEYEHEINNLKDSYSDKKEKSILKKLINIYDKYLSSEIFSDKLRNNILEEYVDVLEEFINKFDLDYEVLLKLADTYMNLDKIEEADEVLKILYKNYPEKYEIYIYSMKLFYMMGNFKEVTSIAREIDSLNLNISDKYNEVVDFWK
ncbi:tetratricopeptide repeat protein [Tepidibacter thalassicus]|uniref:HEAT repeat-containing protein n=1 Tax=Tepidibacter thalassicus DSM 15285 TaxID=1123350 RepID=A0A1M5NXZ6_9FIRM|nr:tetratricopeptide repeat protein [Tepidibacter thalassicus]SHG94382.1 hypothetical protein SAMN02744040_00282 [Tepidibacter thalassicus DSM 15285]